MLDNKYLLLNQKYVIKKCLALDSKNFNSKIPFIRMYVFLKNLVKKHSLERNILLYGDFFKIISGRKNPSYPKIHLYLNIENVFIQDKENEFKNFIGELISFYDINITKEKEFKNPMIYALCKLFYIIDVYANKNMKSNNKFEKNVVENMSELTNLDDDKICKLLNKFKNLFEIYETYNFSEKQEKKLKNKIKITLNSKKENYPSIEITIDVYSFIMSFYLFLLDKYKKLLFKYDVNSKVILNSDFYFINFLEKKSKLMDKIGIDFEKAFVKVGFFESINERSINFDKSFFIKNNEIENKFSETSYHSNIEELIECFNCVTDLFRFKNYEYLFVEKEETNSKIDNIHKLLAIEFINEDTKVSAKKNFVKSYLLNNGFNFDFDDIPDLNNNDKTHKLLLKDDDNHFQSKNFYKKIVNSVDMIFYSVQKYDNSYDNFNIHFKTNSSKKLKSFMKVHKFEYLHLHEKKKDLYLKKPYKSLNKIIYDMLFFVINPYDEKLDLHLDIIGKVNVLVLLVANYINKISSIENILKRNKKTYELYEKYREKIFDHVLTNHFFNKKANDCILENKITFIDNRAFVFNKKFAFPLENLCLLYLLEDEILKILPETTDNIQNIFEKVEKTEFFEMLEKTVTIFMALNNSEYDCFVKEFNAMLYMFECFLTQDEYTYFLRIPLNMDTVKNNLIIKSHETEISSLIIKNNELSNKLIDMLFCLNPFIIKEKSGAFYYYVNSNDISGRFMNKADYEFLKCLNHTRKEKIRKMFYFNELSNKK